LNKEISDFDNWCQSSWGSTIRGPKELFDPDIPQIRDYIDFHNIPPVLKEYIAEKLIIESCRHIGAFQESGDVIWYLLRFAREFRQNNPCFTGRRVQPLKAALLLTARSQFSSAIPIDRNDLDHILAGGAALSAMYLLAQLEFISRSKGRYLDDNGIPLRCIPKLLCKKANLNPKPNRVNQIHQAFILYLYRNGTFVGKRLRILDKKLCIAERLRKIRHPVMHGELPDPSVEATFLALLIAIFYYGET
jgi:hypothetical protein